MANSDVNIDDDVLFTALTTIAAAAVQSDSEPEKTQLGIPVSIIWVPYLGFTIVLIILVGLSFWQYHRKHGHKYHNAQNNGPTEIVTSKPTPDKHHNMTQRPDHDVGDKTRVERRKSGHKRSGSEENRTAKTTNSMTSSRSRAQTKAPPNGGVPTAQTVPNSKPRRYRRDTDTSASEKLLPEKASTQSSQAPVVTAAAVATRNKAGFSKPLDAVRDSNKPHCDEPSTSSSTVSSKNSGGSAGARAAQQRLGNNSNNSSAGKRGRSATKLNFESDANGSMVDVRIPLEDLETFRPARAREKPPVSPSQRLATVRPTPPPPIPAQESTPIVLTAPYWPVAPASMSIDKSPITATTPQITDRIYRGNYVHSNSQHHLDAMAHVLAQQRRPSAERHERGGSVPQHNRNLPAVKRPSLDPFLSSGHMQMLSDTEDDETCLLGKL